VPGKRYEYCNSSSCTYKFYFRITLLAKAISDGLSIVSTSVVDPEWFFSDPYPDSDPTFQLVSDSDPEHVSDLA
jgi:hypothetical protein